MAQRVPLSPIKGRLDNLMDCIRGLIGKPSSPPVAAAPTWPADIMKKFRDNGGKDIEEDPFFPSHQLRFGATIKMILRLNTPGYVEVVLDGNKKEAISVSVPAGELWRFQEYAQDEAIKTVKMDKGKYPEWANALSE